MQNLNGPKNRRWKNPPIKTSLNITYTDANTFTRCINAHSHTHKERKESFNPVATTDP